MYKLLISLMFLTAWTSLGMDNDNDGNIYDEFGNVLELDPQPKSKEDINKVENNSKASKKRKLEIETNNNNNDSDNSAGGNLPLPPIQGFSLQPKVEDKCPDTPRPNRIALHGGPLGGAKRKLNFESDPEI